MISTSVSKLSRIFERVMAKLDLIAANLTTVKNSPELSGITLTMQLFDKLESPDTALSFASCFASRHDMNRLIFLSARKELSPFL